MRCDFCGEDIEGIPFQKDGMNFCSLECSDAMETGESIPLGEDILDDPDEFEDDEDIDDVDDDDDDLGLDDDDEDEDEDEDEDDDSYVEDFADDELIDSDDRY
jgi:hypothetical protein